MKQSHLVSLLFSASLVRLSMGGCRKTTFVLYVPESFDDVLRIIPETIDQNPEACLMKSCKIHCNSPIKKDACYSITSWRGCFSNRQLKNFFSIFVFLQMRNNPDMKLKGPGKINITVGYTSPETYVLEPPPDGFWLFGLPFKGQNLGSKGFRLNCSETYLSWKYSGPRQGLSSEIKFATPDLHQAEYIQLNHGTAPLLDVAKPFTLTFWIRTKYNSKGHMPILEGFPLYSFDLWFYPSRDVDQLTFSPIERPPNQLYTTVKNQDKKGYWRHIGLVVSGPGKVNFFLNGKVWPLESSPKTIVNKTERPYKLAVFNMGKYDVPLLGSMACLMYFEGNTFTRSYVKSIMKSCP